MFSFATHHFSVPIYLKLAKNYYRRKKHKTTGRWRVVQTKRYPLSLNNYARWKSELRNTLKHKFKEEIQDEIDQIRTTLKTRGRTELKLPVQLNLTLHARNPASDLDNFTAVCSKFLLDALQDENLLEGDNISQVVALNYRTGAVDKLNPRMQVELIEGVIQ